MCHLVAVWVACCVYTASVLFQVYFGGAQKSSLRLQLYNWRKLLTGV